VGGLTSSCGRARGVGAGSGQPGLNLASTSRLPHTDILARRRTRLAGEQLAASTQKLPGGHLWRKAKNTAAGGAAPLFCRILPRLPRLPLACQADRHGRRGTGPDWLQQTPTPTTYGILLPG